MKVNLNSRSMRIHRHRLCESVVVVLLLLVDACSPGRSLTAGIGGAESVVLSALSAVSGLRCYVCEGENHLCTVGLLGEKKECAPDTKHCYKSWTVETSPKTVRKCGPNKYKDNECTAVLSRTNTMLSCFCNATDYCNRAHDWTRRPGYTFLILAPVILIWLQSAMIASSSAGI